MIVFRVILIVFLVWQTSFAATLYVDGTLAGNCTGDYSIAARACSGSDGNAQQTIAGGIGAISAGDTLYIRAGTYTEHNITLNFVSDLETLISRYQSESVTIHNDTVPTENAISNATLILYTNVNNALSTRNLRIYGINFTGLKSASFDEDYGAFAIGSTSGGATKLITVEYCTFSGFAHCGIKGDQRFWIKNCTFNNIGGTTAAITDINDHFLYLTGMNSEGSEGIVEKNYFGTTSGACVHIYDGSEDAGYWIIRNNYMYGDGHDSDFSGWPVGILLSGSNCQIYGNFISNYNAAIMPFRSAAINNTITNNYFVGNTEADIIPDDAGSCSQPPGAHTFTGNILASPNPSLYLTDCSGSGGVDERTWDDVPPNSTTQPSIFITGAVGGGSMSLTGGSGSISW